MKNYHLSFVATAMLTAGAWIAVSTANAEDLPQTKARQQLSVTQGFGGIGSLPVLQRAGAASQDQLGAALAGKMRPASAYQTSSDNGALRIAGEDWSMQISSDGSAAEYQDQSVGLRAHSLGRDLSEQMSAANLEQMGRSFIASQLASQIVLGANEELVALRADYRTEGGMDLASGQISRAVVANRIVFGRLIGGVPVVGNGSKVILTFTNDGSLESFHYDWPAYQVGAAQSVVDTSEVLSRVQRVMVHRNGVAAATARVAVPGRGRQAFPVTLTPNAQLQTLECGYYDNGSTATRTRAIQPGCTYLAVSQDANGRQGFSGAVPAGAAFAADAAWMETGILAGQ